MWLDNKKIVVIGGTTGMGLSAASAFVREGARVVVVGRNPESCTAAEGQLDGNGLAMSGDASDPQTAPKAIALCQQIFGGFDGLYHVAGGSGRRFGDGPLHEITLDGWNYTVTLNLTSLMLSNQAAVRAFRAQQSGGTILNMGSVLGSSPSPAYFATHTYAAMKSAVIGFTKSVAAYYASDNIRVNVLAPALVETPMAQRAANDDTIMAFTRTKQPLDGGRIGQPGDLDGAAVYFMSDQSVFTTGASANGGWRLERQRGTAMNAIGIDLGGTWIKGVLMHLETGELVKQLYHPTNGDKDWKQAVAETVADLREQSASPVKAVGLSAPGLPNETNQHIAFMPGRLAGLEGFHWGKFLNTSVHVVNDAHAALLAESRFGVAKGHKNVVMLTLGTGVGGGVLIDGRLYPGNFQKAGSLGHITVDAESDQSITGQPGSLENAIGNATIEKRSMGRFTSTYQLLEGVKQGDYFAQWVWLSSVRKLAVGISALMNCFSPDLVVLGGGITQAEDKLLLPLAEFMSLYEWRPGGRATPIKLAQFGDMAGAIGAASFAIQSDL